MRFAQVLLLTATLSTASFATQVYVTIQGMDPIRSSLIDLQVNGQTWSNISAGGILVEAGNSPVEDYFCIDLFHDISAGTYLDNVNAPNAALRQDRVAWMISNLLPTLSSNSTVSQVQGAGLQLAIWDVITDGGDGFSSGSVRKAISTNSEVLLWAQQYLNASTGKSASNVGVYTVANLNPYGQPYQALMGDLMTPEPGSVTMAAIGLGLLLLGSRRMRVSSSRNTERQPAPDQIA